MNDTLLPDKLSELIRAAIWDLIKVEQEPDLYVVDMDLWHRYIDKKCHVCLAGAVMAQTLGAKPTVSMYPEGYDYDVHNKLVALDNIRVGNVKRTLCHFDGVPLVDVITGVPSRIVKSYGKDRDQFKRDLLTIADELSAEGL